MHIMPKPCPKEFLDDVVRIAGLGGAPLTRIAVYFGQTPERRAELVMTLHRCGLILRTVAVGWA